MTQGELPWTRLDSFRTGKELYRLVERIARRNRKVLPATAPRMIRAASAIGGKLARSTVPVGPPAARALDRAKALRAARYVHRMLGLVQEMREGRKPDPELTAALELSERTIGFIVSGR